MILQFSSYLTENIVYGYGIMRSKQTYSYSVDKDSWRLRVLREVEQDRWLIDGNYKSTFDIRLPESDTIIFLDYPTYISIFQAIKRRIHFRKVVRDDMPSTWKERLRWDFLCLL